MDFFCQIILTLNSGVFLSSCWLLKRLGFGHFFDDNVVFGIGFFERGFLFGFDFG